MRYRLLRGRESIDPATNVHVFVKPVHQAATQAHTHDFYEIFLIARGALRHRINGRVDTLPAGHLVFMRPEDRHYFEPPPGQNGELVNLAFARRTFETVRRFLGDGFSPAALRDPPLPPGFALRPAEARALAARMLRLGRYGVAEKAGARADARTLLAELYLEHFTRAPRDRKAALPPWLATLVTVMRKPEHFTRGLPALRALAHRSPEHLCRAFRRHLGCTPTAFVNDLRLDHAARLLAETDAKVAVVALDAGFENLSHFYHEFRRRHDLSPADYRHRMRRSEVL